MLELFVAIGTVLNLAGSLFVAYSVKENPGGAHQMLDNGEKIYLAVIDYRKFRAGIVLLIFGFLFQLFGIVGSSWIELAYGVIWSGMGIFTIYFLYFGLALLSSLFVTIFALKIHNLPIKSWADLSWPSRINQWLLNFLGSFVGWVALSYIIFWRLQPGMSLEFTDLIILLVAFYGISGYLPFVLIQKGLPWK